MRYTLLGILLLICLAAPLQAAKYAGEFLEIGVGARAVGMGGAVTAITDDPMSFYWNPAGMGYLSGLHVSGMYADLWNGLANYSVAGIALPASGAVLAANYVRLGVPDIQQHPDYDALLLSNRLYTINNGDTTFYNSVQAYLLATGAAPAGVFSDNESALFVTFARNNQFTLDLGWSYFTLPVEIPVGASLKIINQSLGGASGSATGADVGMQVKVKASDIFNENWKATFAWGFNVQDLTRTAINWGQNNKDAIPTNFRNGVAYIQKMPGRNSFLTLSYDVEKRWERVSHYGAEFRYARTLALRGGLWGKEWTAGAGLSIWRASVASGILASCSFLSVANCSRLASASS